jgi:DNA-binding response OmpR family regulator
MGLARAVHGHVHVNKGALERLVMRTSRSRRTQPYTRGYAARNNGPRSSGKNVRVLFVEDEDLIRLIVTEELAHAGFEVCEAASGEQAARIIESQPAPFDLLVTDIHMPGALDGLAVALVVRGCWPLVPVIYTTGRPDVLDRMGRLDDNTVLLPKPYLPSALLDVAQRLLTGQQSGRAPKSAGTGQNRSSNEGVD